MIYCTIWYERTTAPWNLSTWYVMICTINGAEFAMIVERHAPPHWELSSSGSRGGACHSTIHGSALLTISHRNMINCLCLMMANASGRQTLNSSRILPKWSAGGNSGNLVCSGWECQAFTMCWRQHGGKHNILLCIPPCHLQWVAGRMVLAYTLSEECLPVSIHVSSYSWSSVSMLYKDQIKSP